MWLIIDGQVIEGCVWQDLISFFILPTISLEEEIKLTVKLEKQGHDKQIDTHSRSGYRTLNGCDRWALETILWFIGQHLYPYFPLAVKNVVRKWGTNAVQGQRLWFFCPWWVWFWWSGDRLRIEREKRISVGGLLYLGLWKSPSSLWSDDREEIHFHN